MNDGTAAMAANLAAIGARVTTAAVEGLGDWAEFVLSQSTRQVPLEEAVLQNSGTTAVDAGAKLAAVGYGRGAAAPYAVIQHEKPMNHDPGRKDHYLSDPVNESADRAPEFVARRIRQVL